MPKPGPPQPQNQHPKPADTRLRGWSLIAEGCRNRVEVDSCFARLAKKSNFEALNRKTLDAQLYNMPYTLKCWRTVSMPHADTCFTIQSGAVVCSKKRSARLFGCNRRLLVRNCYPPPTHPLLPAGSTLPNATSTAAVAVVGGGFQPSWEPLGKGGHFAPSPYPAKPVLEK